MGAAVSAMETGCQAACLSSMHNGLSSEAGCLVDHLVSCDGKERFYRNALNALLDATPACVHATQKNSSRNKLRAANTKLEQKTTAVYINVQSTLSKPIQVNEMNCIYHSRIIRKLCFYV